ncbi:YesL family protein [Actinoplanes sp. CA-252034]|uniref:YesL family protein n=1 Tax=Actinoplanes sp. CA-252034 TaxID=3239906 RepID=UPI003D99F3F7
MFWAIRLNLLWLLFTVVGGVVPSIGPATVAAYSLARRHARNETFRVFPAFLAAFRQDILRGTALFLPSLAASAFLLTNYFWFASMGSAGMIFRLVTAVALAAVVVITGYLLPMAAHYHLRTRAYLPTASLFALTRPAASVLLLFSFTAIAYAAVTFPFLLPTIAVGGWIQFSTWLCQRLFAENEERLRVERKS